MIKTSLFSEAIDNRNIKLQIVFWLINNMENSNIPYGDETVKGASTDTYKMVLQKVLFMWSSMPIFSFIGYSLTKLFRKPDNKRVRLFIYQNDVSRRKNKLICHNKDVSSSW